MLFLIQFVQGQFITENVNPALSNECKSVLLTQGQTLNQVCYKDFDFKNIPQKQADWITNFEKMIPSLCSPACTEQSRQFISFTDFACDAEAIFKNGNTTANQFGNIQLFLTGASCPKTKGNQYCIIEQARQASSIGILESFTLGDAVHHLQGIVSTNQTKQGLLCSECTQAQLAKVKEVGGLTDSLSAMVRNIDSQFKSRCSVKELAKDAGNSANTMFSSLVLSISLALLI